MARSFFAALLGSVALLNGSGGVSARTLTTLYSFSGGADGEYPVAGLIADASGALYGTTESGGSCCGTVFKLTPPTTTGGPWAETVLYSFTGGADGAQPVASLIADASGALYGTTEGGGSGYGTVFKLTLPAICAGVPGKANCHGQSISFLANTCGGIAAAATALGYFSVTDFQNAVAVYCAGQATSMPRRYCLRTVAPTGGYKNAHTRDYLNTHPRLASLQGWDCSPAGRRFGSCSGACRNAG
jgi:uncharacterized repeat protein (TIGR03803 family)